MFVSKRLRQTKILGDIRVFSSLHELLQARTTGSVLTANCMNKRCSYICDKRADQNRSDVASAWQNRRGPFCFFPLCYE
jgi:hypothetical protein